MRVALEQSLGLLEASGRIGIAGSNFKVALVYLLRDMFADAKVILLDLNDEFSCVARMGTTRYYDVVKGAGLILIIILSAIPFINTFAMAPELAYDDGGAEEFWSDYYPNGMAVKFRPPSSRWRITAILIYGFMIDKDEKSFIVEVMDKDLNVIFRASLPISEYFKNATLHWAKVPLPGVIVEDDFYVCIYPMLDFNGTQLWIAIDDDTASDRCFLVDCYKQEVKSWKGGHAMIRVEGGEAINFIDIILDSISINEDALELYFKVTASSNDTKVRATIQMRSLTEDCEVVREKGLYKTRIEWSRLLNVKEPVKLMLSARTLNLTATLTIKLNETILSKYLRLKEENKHLETMMNSSKAEIEVLRNKLEKKGDATAFLSTLLKEYQEMLSEENEENERLIKELSILRLLTTSLATLMTFLLFRVLRRRARLGSL